jgi:hypothetical protein
MASPVWSLQPQWLFIVLLLVFTTAATSCYTSIFSFGDSLTDTGNLYFISQPQSPNCLLPPYGETHFHHPNGRCSDGRLIVYFIGITQFPSYPFSFSLYSLIKIHSLYKLYMLVIYKSLSQILDVDIDTRH